MAAPCGPGPPLTGEPPDPAAAREGRIRTPTTAGCSPSSATWSPDRLLRGADQAITSAIDSHVQAEQRGGEDDGDGEADVLAPVG
jgi:hypothetical protein